MALTYLDFFLEVWPSSSTTCRVVVRSPRGECVHEVVLPLKLDDLTELRAHLHQEALRHTPAPRDMGPPGGVRGQREVIVEVPPRAETLEFGKALYNALFQGDVGERFAANREYARSVGKGLRVNIVTHDPALALVPWELLCSRQGDFLCLSEHTPLVRYILVGKPQAPLRVEAPLQVLGVLSTGGGGPLDLEREQLHINAALDPLLKKGHAEITWLRDPTSQDLLETLGRRDWHILHFAGHGTFDRSTAQGLLSIASEGGGHGHLRATDLRVLLRDRHSVRMVFLNACDGASGDVSKLLSSTAALVAEAGVPAVLAMQFPISDKSASKFARQVYQQIAAGDSIEEAVAEARKGICIGGSLEWATPVLFMRSAEGAFLQNDVGRPSRPAAQSKPASPPVAMAPPPPASSRGVAPPEGPPKSARSQPPASRRIRARHVLGIALLAAAAASALAIPLAARWGSDSMKPPTPYPGLPVSGAMSATPAPPEPPKNDWSKPCDHITGVAGWVAETRAALCDQERGKPATAWRRLDEMLRRAGLDAEAARFVRERMAGLEQAAGRLQVQTPEKGVELRLFSGGKEVPGLALRANDDVLVDPGGYTIAVRRAGYRDRTMRVVVEPGERATPDLPKAEPNEQPKKRVCTPDGYCIWQ